MTGPRDGLNESGHAPTYPVNIEIFRAESKTENAREFSENGNGLHITCKGNTQYPHTDFTVPRRSDNLTMSVFLPYSHHGLSHLLTHYEFNDILEIGSRAGAAAQILDFCGKQVSTVEVNADYPSDYRGDFVAIEFDRRFDAIWCSHVLEHQRNFGIFLDKAFDTLKEGGVLALTVPSALSPVLLGHPSIFAPGHMLCALISSGVNC